MKRTCFNTHFLDRLHLEPRVVAPRTRSGLPNDRPWTRDLDVRWWIGGGWILTPDGPKRVVENGAAPGTEIFQGKGLSKHREPEDEEVKAGDPIKRARSNTDFQELLHPEPCAEAPRPRSGLWYERLPVMPPEMKMWPWMRELGVDWWVGRSWTPTPDGPKHVGTEAAPGREVFQGKGLSKHRGPKDDEAKASSSTAPRPATGEASSSTTPRPAAGEASSSTAPRPARRGASLPAKGKKVRVVQAKQSGFQGVSWDTATNCWRCQWKEGGKHRHKKFFVHRYMESRGKSYEEADAAAMRDAIRYRKRLIKDGVIKLIPKFRQDGIKGVWWDAKNRAWIARFRLHGKSCNAGIFHPRDNTRKEKERARLAAVERRQQFELEHWEIQRKEAADPSEMQKKRPSGVAGVIWDCHALAWRATIFANGKHLGKTFRPKDLSDESVEAARLEAVQHRRDLERQCRGTCKTSS